MMQAGQKRIIALSMLILSMSILVISSCSAMAYAMASITGKAVAYGKIFVQILPKCSAELKPGWNLVSLCLNKSGKIDEIFNYNLTNFRYVLRWNEAKAAFDVYSPKATNNPFDATELNESYFILVYNNYSLGYAGSDTGDLAIEMQKGWNNPSWPYEFNASIEKYFNSSLHRYLMKWNNDKQEFDIYSPLSSSNPFNEIFVGEGQFIFSKIAHTLFYNRTNLKS
jgi:hypothetical protein